MHLPFRFPFTTFSYQINGWLNGSYKHFNAVVSLDLRSYGNNDLTLITHLNELYMLHEHSTPRSLVQFEQMELPLKCFRKLEICLPQRWCQAMGIISWPDSLWANIDKIHVVLCTIWPNTMYHFPNHSYKIDVHRPHGVLPTECWCGNHVNPTLNLKMNY